MSLKPQIASKSVADLVRLPSISPWALPLQYTLKFQWLRVLSGGQSLLCPTGELEIQTMNVPWEQSSKRTVIR